MQTVTNLQRFLFVVVVFCSSMIATAQSTGNIPPTNRNPPTGNSNPNNDPSFDKKLKDAMVKKEKSDSLTVIGLRSSRVHKTQLKKPVGLKSTDVKYDPYENGLVIPAAMLGAERPGSLYDVTAVNCYMVSSRSIVIEPDNKGMVNYDLELQNGKKYIIALTYTKNHNGVLKVSTLMSPKGVLSNNKQDVEYELPASALGAQDELSFIVAPNLTATPVLCRVQFSLTSEYTKEASKTAAHANHLDIIKVLVKEVDF